MEENKTEESLIERLTRRKILVIDDDPMVLKTIKEFLSDSYEIAAARSGSVAYRYLESNPVDLVLLDYEMPGEKGTSVMQNIHKINFASNVPIIFLTGTADSQIVAQILRLKPDGYLLKPVDKEKLIKKISQVLNKK
ncbi:MAG: response regulator [Treponema sp.]|nr:response regulator [Treponema sp.]